MTRPFFALGSYKTRTQISASASFGARGASSLSAAPLFSGAATFVPRGMSFARSSLSVVGTAGLTPQIVDLIALAWNVGNITLSEGETGQSEGQFNVAATGPVGYTVGGIYDVVSGNPLPLGSTMTSAGLIDVGSATQGTETGIIFGYSEPGALPTLTLHPTTTATLPYMATVYPAEGAVPSGATLVSSVDTNLRSSVLSTWPDGSAQVMVVAGETAVTNGVQKPIPLNPAVVSQTPLTDARIAQLVTNITFTNFTGSPTTLTLSGATKDRTWWANERVICNRYRQSLGLGVMEAVIDIHAFASNRAFVEVVIENSRMNSSSPSIPSAQAYSNVSVTVNSGSVTLASGVNDPPNGTTYQGTPIYVAGTHEPFRAWYCSGWVGGDPGIEVTHDATSIQSHPLLFKIAVPSSVDHSAYSISSFNGVSQPFGSDVYAPWVYGRHRGAGMGVGADHDSIGNLTRWDTTYLQSGSKYARRASIANALAILSYGINYRDSTTNLVPTLSQTAGKRRSGGGGWPQLSTEPAFEEAHHPATGLIAFLCRPSPCFIELSQKVALWNLTWATTNGSITGSFQTRGIAWTLRSQVHAMFLTPDSANAWKTASNTAFSLSLDFIDSIRNNSGNLLGLMLDGYQNDLVDLRDDAAGFQSSLWQHHWFAGEFHKIAGSKVLTGTAQTRAIDTAEWACAQPIRYVNESSSGEWRTHNYKTCVGRANYDINNNTGLWGGGLYQGPTTDSLSTWSAQHDWFYTDSPPAETGSVTWLVSGDSLSQSWSVYSSQPVAHSGLNYVEHFWSAFAVAVERGVSGADTAWSRVTSAMGGNLTTWLAGFGADPRQGVYPRNK